MKRILPLVLLLSVLCSMAFAQNRHRSAAKAKANDNVNLREFFEQYTNPNYPNLGKITVEDIQTDTQEKSVNVVLSDNFIAQPVTPLVVGDLSEQVKRLLPANLNGYRLTIQAAGYPI